MKIDIYLFRSYKAYLNSFSEASAKRGAKAKIAKALGCQPTYVSQVFNRSVHLSLEQADKLNEFLGHSEDEAKYFILLVQKDRAGTRSLERHFKTQIEQILSQRVVVTQRLGIKDSLSVEEQAIYYSSWYYSAVHIALTIPGLNSKESIATYLGISVKKVGTVLSFLVSAGLVQNVGGSLKIKWPSVALTSDSPNLPRHHANWRIKAVDSVGVYDKKDLHYTAVISISKEDIDQIKNETLSLLKKHRDLISRSKEEDLYCYAIDIFKLEANTSS